MTNLLIKKDGIIIANAGSSSEKNVTDVAILYLMQPCEIEDGVTLKDIFLILKRDMSFYKTLIQNWVEEIVEEGLSPTKSQDDASQCKIDYLELSWNLTAESGKENYFSGLEMPEFHGVGSWPATEHNPEGSGAISIMFSPANHLANIPLKLKQTLNLDLQTEYKFKERITYHNPTYTLLQILYAIIWEMSFLGKPEKRNTELEKLNQVVEDVKNGTAELIPMEDAFKQLKERVAERTKKTEQSFQHTKEKIAERNEKIKQSLKDSKDRIAERKKK
jgi:hypothetical protein